MNELYWGGLFDERAIPGGAFDERTLYWGLFEERAILRSFWRKSGTGAGGFFTKELYWGRGLFHERAILEQAFWRKSYTGAGFLTKELYWRRLFDKRAILGGGGFLTKELIIYSKWSLLCFSGWRNTPKVFISLSWRLLNDLWSFRRFQWNRRQLREHYIKSKKLGIT